MLQVLTFCFLDLFFPLGLAALGTEGFFGGGERVSGLSVLSCQVLVVEVEFFGP